MSLGSLIREGSGIHLELLLLPVHHVVSWRRAAEMVGTIASNVYKRGVIFGTLTSLAILKRIFYKTDVLQYIYLLISMSICFYIIVYTYTHNSHICTYHWNLRSPIVDLGNQKKHGAA